VSGLAAIAEGEGRTDDLAALGDVEFEIGAGENFLEGSVGEAEHAGEEAVKIPERRSFVRGKLARAAQGCLELRGRALDALGFDEDGERDNEPFDGLHHAEPGLVEVVVFVFH
jgi:hypothetical protein